MTVDGPTGRDVGHGDRMMTSRDPSGQGTVRPGESSFSWLDLLARVWGRKKTVAVFGLGAMIASVLVMLVVPETYRARCVLLPPRSEGGSSLATMLSATATRGFTTLGSASFSSDVFVEILNSRTAASAVVDSLGLISDYRVDGTSRELSMEKAIGILRTRFSAGRALNGVITVTAEHKTGFFPLLNRDSRERARMRSAEIANAFVYELNRINVDKNTSGARNARLYLEEQIEKTRADRAAAADRLIQFQRVHGAVSLEDQARVTMEAAGRLQAEILARRLELRLALQTESESSRRIRTLRSEIEAMEGEYRNLYGGIDGRAADSASAAMIPILELPELSFRYSEVLRELKTQDVLLEVLLQQYYEARLEESRDTPVVQVLDPALPPVGKAAPRRTLTVLLATLLGGIVGLAYVTGSDHLQLMIGRVR